MDYILNVNLDDVRVINAALIKMPYRMVVGLIEKLDQQLKAQANANSNNGGNSNSPVVVGGEGSEGANHS